MPEPLFYERVFPLIEAAVRQAGAGVPELEAVACIALWRLPDQQGIPAAILVGVDGPVASPDQLARLGLVTARFQQQIAERHGSALVKLKQLETELMRLVHEQKAQLEILRQASTEHGTAPDIIAPDTPGGDRSADPGVGPA